jgi:gliding motility-associated-like protein
VVQVAINPLPLANAGPQPGWVCPGFNTTITAYNGVTYVWSPAASLSNPNISNPVATPSVNTTYTVNITDANGCKNWDTLTLFLNPVVPTNAGTDPTICFGQSTTLGGSPTSPSPNTTYQWFPSTGLNNSTLANPVASPVATTTYIVASASDTCSGVDTVIVFVNQLPVVSAGADVSICFGNTVTLTASGGTTYLWNTGVTTTSLTAAATAAATYTVIGTDANGCSNIDSATVFVNALPVVSAGADVSICYGDSTLLTGSGAISYSWSTAATTTSISVTPTAASSYTVIGTDANGCSNKDSASVFVNALPVVSAGADVSICFGSTTTLTGSGAISYSWSTTATTTSISVSPTSSSTYTIIGTDANGCSNTDTATVFVNSLPIVDAGANVSICIGDSSSLNGSGGTNYIWSPSTGLNNPNISNPVADPTTTITYTLVATDANFCSNTDTVNVTVLSLPGVTASNDTAICAGDSAFLSASGGISYTWSPASSLNNSNISNPIATPTSTTTYTVTLVGVNGCINYDTVKVIVNPLPVIDAGLNTIVCPGDSVSLAATGGINYIWSPAGGLSSTTNSNPHANPSSATTYTVIGTDANGCSNTDSVSVSIGIIPTANFGYSLSLACEGMAARFLDSSLNATSLSWVFGDGSSSVQQDPVHSFPYNSGYVITLVATNPPCSDTVQKTISVSDISDYVTFKTSNVFTPNGDGINDCFNLIPTISGVDDGMFAGCAYLTIYNRWGVPVHYSAYSGTCWDGRTSTGSIVPEGTYFYIFDMNGIQFKGFITVLR